MSRFALAIHGGAGTIPRATMTPEKEARYRATLAGALQQGWYILEQGGSALDAVEQAVIALEDTPLFNAGKGAVFTHDKTNEMDASIMCGQTLQAGAVGAVRNVRNPITLARQIMEHSAHVLLCGEGAARFAHEMNLAFEPDAYFYDEHRYQQLLKAMEQGQILLDHDEPALGTVGAVARDSRGNLAAATSTGGMTNKKSGRIGDSAVIAAGTYAHNATCAISATGDGEALIRCVTAHTISALMAYAGLGLAEACRIVIHEKLPALEGEGGVIAVDHEGQLCLPFNSEGMYRAWISQGQGPQTAIY